MTRIMSKVKEALYAEQEFKNKELEASEPKSLSESVAELNNLVQRSEDLRTMSLMDYHKKYGSL